MKIKREESIMSQRKNHYFASKLYKHYYPIKTDEDKNYFINNNSNKIYKILRKTECLNYAAQEEIIDKYFRKEKDIVSICGHIKWKNIVHNRQLEIKRNSELEKLEEDNEKIDDLINQIHTYSLSIDDVNTILIMDNRYFQHNIGLFITFISYCLVLFALFY